MLLEFKEWENEVINEASKPMDKIVNWLSSNFGGSIGKIDSLLSKISKIETDYASDWNDIQTDVDALEIKKAQTKNDPAENKKLERMIDRNHKLTVALGKKKNADINDIDKKVEDVTKDNERLVSYWNLKKSELEVELAEKLYKHAKTLTDDSVADQLYDKYKDAALEAKRKDEMFREKFGKMDLAKGIQTEDVPKGNFSIDPILGMNSVQFTKYAQGLSLQDVKSLVSFLIKERNERYVTLDQEKEKLEDAAEKKGESKTSVSKDVKEIRELLMGQIRDLRTKITIARRYA